MFYVNNEKITKSGMEKIISNPDLHNMENPEGKLIALCLKRPDILFSYLRHIKKYSGSILLLHSDLNLQVAKNQATQAGCDYLIHSESFDIIKLKKITNEIYEPSLYQFSSGTTNNPKLIGRSWDSISEEISNYNKMFPNDQKERPIILVPTSHSFGLISGLMSAIQRDVEPIVITEKNPKFAVNMIKMHPNSTVYAVPFLLHVLLEISKDSIKFHKVVSSGSPLNSQLLYKLLKNSNAVMQQYGNTELGCISISENIKTSSDVGKPLPYFGIELNKSREKRDEIIVNTENGYVPTNDLGLINEEGNLHYLGRMDDMINVSGQKVFPYEIEGIISEIPGIEDVVVYKIPHKVWGESVKAMIVGNGTITSRDIKKHCLENLPSYKIPSVIQLVEEIPRNRMGKINRKHLFELEAIT
jgi:acyl-coenzyme A synthetase/AMP-(fatty) acid ligase